LFPIQAQFVSQKINSAAESNPQRHFIKLSSQKLNFLQALINFFQKFTDMARVLSVSMRESVIKKGNIDSPKQFSPIIRRRNR